MKITTPQLDPPTGNPALRPQSLLLTFFGDHLYDQGSCVYSGSVIDVLARVGVSEHATRSTLTRMVNRGLLHRQRDGQRMYFGLTPRSVDILRDGQQRIWKTGAVNHDWDGSWTLLGFSLPESWQRQRHDLRSQLTWAGFGPLQGGLWIAPGQVPVDQIVADLGLSTHVRVFHAHADQLTDIRQMINDAYDLDQLATGYRAFLSRWHDADPQPFPDDPLAGHLSIVTEWLQVIRRDPRLPVHHLPDNWPAVPAQQTFQHIEAHLIQPARTLATSLLRTVPDKTLSGQASNKPTEL